MVLIFEKINLEKDETMNIGIDLGGTNISGGVVDEKGNILLTKSLYTMSERDSLLIIKDIIKVIESLKKEAFEKGISIESVGIGVPGPVDVDNGIVLLCVNLGWENIHLVDILKEKTQLPVFLQNDGSLAGFAEFKFGALKNISTGVLLTLGTGVGGAVVIDNHLVESKNGIASELGHMVVGENFYDCNCGKNGCLETFSSATAIKKYVRQRITDGERNTIILNMAKNDIKKIGGKMIIEAAKKGDKLALEAVDRLASYLGLGIVNIASVIDPEVFLIGGGLSKTGDFLLDKIKAAVNNHKFFQTLGIGDVKIAKFGSEAGVIGAAAYAESRMTKDKI